VKVQFYRSARLKTWSGVLFGISLLVNPRPPQPPGLRISFVKYVHVVFRITIRIARSETFTEMCVVV
jgi:hypothetical protein